LGRHGSIASAASARKVSGQLLLSEFTSVDQGVLNAMGELTNMIVGNFRI
jgi:CheY-specific phosphatase CheX